MDQATCTAPGCNEALEPSRGTRTRIYCSKSCASRAHYLRNRTENLAAARRARRDERARALRCCEACGEPIPASRTATAIYCTEECGKRAWEAANRDRLRELSRASYARRKDRVNAKLRAANVAKREAIDRTCAECGNPIPAARNMSAKYCSKRCGANASRDNTGATCREANCERPVRARGLCSMHWKRAHRSQESRKVDAEYRRERRERDKLDPAKVAKERERQRLKRQRLTGETMPGWRSLANDLPRQVDAEMDALESKLRLIECAECEAPILTSKSSQVMCSSACKRRAKSRRRRAAERGAIGDHSRSELIAIWRQIDRQCGYCEMPTALSDLQGDHFVSLANGGTNYIGNMVPACPACNADKRELSMSEWAADRKRRGLAPRSLHPKISHLTSLTLAA